ncbi:hypothetical protein [Marinomonas pollencensis]|uniref:SmpA/OmlA family protein n=1 Tax=Marinomonas pollencensis TaxID=491954 RepID=A0A3E0DTI8_9GAMM|nr:hypothetical protein [Marinomonas pollencensis]REG86706.1 hypothetical protein DFP81_101271 [Marinomonas pollencensis]
MRLIFTLFIATLITSCSLINQKALSLQVGMGKTEVSEIMGTPERRSFNGTTEAWQYADFISKDQCSYITAWFKGESLAALTSREETRMRDCSKGILDIDWTQIPMGVN